MDNRIQVRVDHQLKKALEDLIGDSNQSMSDLIRFILKNYITEVDGKAVFTKPVKKYIQGLKKTAFMSDLFLISNAYKSIYQVNRAFIYNSGKLNMQITREIIKRYTDMYESMNEISKDLLYDEIKNLQLLGQEEILEARYASLLRQSKLIEMKKEVKIE